MNRLKVVKQHDITDCGPACLSSIIQYFGGYVPIEVLRLKCETSMNGTSAYNLIEAAKYYGLRAEAIKVNSMEDIKSKVNFPCIVHLKLKNNLNHFAALYQVKKSGVILMDPSIGKTKMNFGEFEKVFTNVIILFRKKSTLISYEKPKSISQIISTFVKQNKNETKKLIICSLFLITITIFSNYYIKLGSYFSEGGFGLPLLIYLILIFLIIYVLKNIIEYLKNVYITGLNKNISASLYESFSHQLYVLPLNFIKSKTSGEIISRFNELSQYNDILPQLIISIFLDVMMAICALVASVFISPVLSAFTIVTMTIYFLVGFAFKNPTLQRINRNIGYSSDFNTTIIDNVNNIVSTKYMSNEDMMERRLEKSGAKYLYNNLKTEEFFNKVNFIKNAIFDLGSWLTLSIGLYMSFLGKISIINIFLFEMIISYFREPIKDFVNIIPKICFIKSSLIKLSEFMIIKKGKNGNVNFKSGEITINGLSYSYEDEKYILKDFSANISERDKVLIKGDSGSGKSTFCQILSRQLDFKEGTIRINGTNIKDISESEYHKNICYIGQKDSLLVDTIYNNIIYERNIDIDKFKTICSICEIDDIVDGKIDRYNTLIYESAQNISGGEKQRIALARGLLSSSPVIILDEALSEINKDMEERILKKIFKEFKDKTILYVSHKEYKNIFNKVIQIG